jgi:hypothetical protein
MMAHVVTSTHESLEVEVKSAGRLTESVQLAPPFVVTSTTRLDCDPVLTAPAAKQVSVAGQTREKPFSLAGVASVLHSFPKYPTSFHGDVSAPRVGADWPVA